jgi:8-amino-7-oxononanoate synthase
MDSLDRYARDKLQDLDARSLRRHLVETDRGTYPTVSRHGRRLVSFSCNDYLGLSVDPAVRAAAKEAIDRFGTGAGASRLVTGNHPLFADLERGLARAKETQDACVFGSGYLANVGVISALAGPDDLILLDEYAHSCLHAGASLSGATQIVFAHNAAVDVAALLSRHRNNHRHVLIVTETVFSMDGDRAPIGALAEQAARYDAWLLTDDAHGFGVVAPDPAPVALRMGTLSKALGSYGGYVAASSPVIDLIKTRARALIYSTGLPPASVAAALAALERLQADPDLAARPLANARRFARRLDLPVPESPIVPIILGTPEAALAASQTLDEAGFLVTAIRPPTVPAGTARLRFAFCADHQAEDIDRLAEVVRPLLRPLAQRETCLASS